MEDWNKILFEISKSVETKYFNAFISTLKVESLSSEILSLVAPNESIKQHNEKRYAKIIESAAKTILGNPITIRFKLEDTDQPSEHPVLKNNKPDILNPNFTFDEFLVGNSNRLAEFAARNLVTNQESLNPLFLYGKIGTGKTHLLQAIGNEFAKQNPKANVRIVDTPSFLNEFVNSVRNSSRDSLDLFKLKNQSASIFLIDDIQFLNSGAEKTQEEFFYVFNYLYDRKIPIVITSDRPNYELPIQDRLKSRIVTGTCVEIKQPDKELRTKIIQHFSKRYELFLTPEAQEFLATAIQEDTRSIIGALNDILLHRRVFGQLILDISQIRSCVESRLKRKHSEGYWEEKIIEFVCSSFKKERKDLLGKSRKQELVVPRHLCIHFLIELLQKGKSEAGRIFGVKHSSVIHAVENAKEFLKANPEYELEFQKLRNEFL